jgi:hypothetical protein
MLDDLATPLALDYGRIGKSLSPEALRPRLSTGLPLLSLMQRSTTTFEL